MKQLYSMTAEVLTVNSLLNNESRIAITTREYDYEDKRKLS